MGRSVSTPSNTLAVVYRDVTDLDADDFEWFIDDLRYQLGSEWPSVVHQDCWIGREDHVIAGNDLVYFGVSEYCGLASIWIVLANGQTHEQLALQWVDQIKDKFEATFGELRLVGRASNGEAFFIRAETAA